MQKFSREICAEAPGGPAARQRGGRPPRPSGSGAAGPRPPPPARRRIWCMSPCTRHRLPPHRIYLHRSPSSSSHFLPAGPIVRGHLTSDPDHPDVTVRPRCPLLGWIDFITSQLLKRQWLLAILIRLRVRFDHLFLLLKLAAVLSQVVTREHFSFMVQSTSTMHWPTFYKYYRKSSGLTK